MSPAGTSTSGPMWRYSSVMNAWQKRMTSASLLPRGSKSEPPFAPPIGRVVRLSLKDCSKARNFITERFTEGWNRRPPLKGPIAPLNWTRYPRLTWTLPASSVQVTRNEIIRSGSTMRSSRPAFSYSGCLSITGAREERTSSTVCWNSGSDGWFFLTSSRTLSTYLLTIISLPNILCAFCIENCTNYIIRPDFSRPRKRWNL